MTLRFLVSGSVSVKKSIRLLVLLCGVINAEPSQFVVQQMLSAIEEIDAHAVKTLMEEYQFHKYPDLIDRFLVSARDVLGEQKGRISLGGSRFDLLTLALGLGICGVSAMLAMSKSSSGSGYQSLDSGDVGFDMPVDPSWFERHRKKIEAVPLFVIGSYLTKRGLYCEHAKNLVRSAHDILKYLETAGLKTPVEVEKEAEEASFQKNMNWVDSLSSKGRALIAKLPLDQLIKQLKRL